MWVYLWAEHTISAEEFLELVGSSEEEALNIILKKILIYRNMKH